MDKLCDKRGQEKAVHANREIEELRLMGVQKDMQEQARMQTGEFCGRWQSISDTRVPGQPGPRPASDVAVLRSNSERQASPGHSHSGERGPCLPKEDTRETHGPPSSKRLYFGKITLVKS